MHVNARKFNVLSNMIDLSRANEQIDTNWSIRAIIWSGVLPLISAKSVSSLVLDCSRKRKTCQGKKNTKLNMPEKIITPKLKNRR